MYPEYRSRAIWCEEKGEASVLCEISAWALLIDEGVTRI
jgi:hypothetical protein